MCMCKFTKTGKLPISELVTKLHLLEAVRSFPVLPSPMAKLRRLPDIIKDEADVCRKVSVGQNSFTVEFA